MDTIAPPVDTGPPPPAPGTVLFSSSGDFDERRWNATGNVAFSSSWIHNPTSRGCNPLDYAIFNDPAALGWRDYEVNVTVFFLNDCSNPRFAVVSRTTGNAATCGDLAGYACSIDFDDDDMFVSRVDSACGFADINDRRGTGSINTGQWYDLSFSVIGDTISCTFEGTTSSYTDSTHDRGSFGLLFDRIHVDLGSVEVIAR